MLSCVCNSFLYNQDGYDFLILAEDELAKYVIDQVVLNERLFEGKLYHILPCGDWRNTARLHKEIIDSNLTSSSTKIISVLDGDVVQQFEKEKTKIPDLNRLNVTFLPIPSLEKYLHANLIDNVDATLFREINDRFFRRKSLDTVISDYQNGVVDQKGKRLWELMVSAMSDDGMSEKEFLRAICAVVYTKVNSEGLSKRISAMF